jgi:outer membrane lipoprotein SlyB
MRKLLIIAAANAVLFAGAAQAGPVGRAAVGAGAGAIVAGPVGAVAGGAAGAALSPKRRHEITGHHARHHVRSRHHH